MLTLCRASPMCSSLLTFDSSSDFGCATDTRAEGARMHVQHHGSIMTRHTCNEYGCTNGMCSETALTQSITEAASARYTA